MSNAFGPPDGQFGPPQGPPQGPPPQGPPGQQQFGQPQFGQPFPPGPATPVGPGGPPGPPGAPFPPPPPRRNSAAPAILIIGIGGTLVLALIAVIGFAFFTGFFDSATRTGGDSPGISAAPSDDAGTGGSSAGSGDIPDSGPTSPSPDPTEDAFKAVTAGDCLTVWDTGHGGATTAEWSSDEPPAAVSCKTNDALVQVTGTNGNCESGTGLATWTYSSASSGDTTQLCLRRIYHKGGCLLAKQEGGKITGLGPMTAVDCGAKKVPIAYNQVMHITGVYNTSKGTDASLCRRAQGDQTTYWSWTVDDGDTLLCTMVYQG